MCILVVRVRVPLELGIPVIKPNTLAMAAKDSTPGAASSLAFLRTGFLRQVALWTGPECRAG